MNIHKSQGGTFDAVVYKYDRKHSRELVYIALTRETKIQGLFMVKKIKSVAYSSQGSQTGQLDFCNWLADGSTTG